MSPRTLALLAAATAALGCYDPAQPIDPASLAGGGAWGGPDVSLVLEAAGGTLSYACGAGTIAPGWTITPGGHLAATGEHFFGGGPLPPQGHPAHPARYQGEIHGDLLVLTVSLEDLQQTLGPFTLRRDGPVVNELCL